MQGIEKLAKEIRGELLKRLPKQRKTQRDKLSTLVATMLLGRSGEAMTLGQYLPHSSDNRLSRFQWIKRFLANHLVCPAEVMEPFAREVLAQLAAKGRQVVLIIDQSQATTVHRHEMLMVAVHAGNRALPLAWRVKETSGGIGFADQKALLEQVAAWLPKGAKVMLMGDRFYGTPDMINLCRSLGWGWRLRLKGNLLVFDEAGGEITLGECVEQGVTALRKVDLTEKRARTHVAILHEEGHPEPWIIASSDAPTEKAARDYGMRWGIEAMFSDLKSRGMDLTQSQLRRADRIERLMLVMAVALYHAVSTGL